MMNNFKLMKEQQKQHLIDMMKADEELGLYDEDSPAYNHQARLVHDLGNKIKLEQEYNSLNYGGGFTEEDIKRVSTKRQTLEEAAKVYAEPYRCPSTNDNEYCKHDIISAFNNGAKWQEERMYSKEEVIELLQKALTHKDDGEIGSLVTAQGEIRPANFFSWFNKFKNQ